MESHEIAQRLLESQAELQTALGLYRLWISDPSLFGQLNGQHDHIEMRLQACLAMQHKLMGELDLPMFSPTEMPEGWTPA